MTISKNTKRTLKQYLVILFALFIAYLTIWCNMYLDVNNATEAPVWSIGVQTIQTPTAEAKDVPTGKQVAINGIQDPCTMPNVTCDKTPVSCYTGIESKGANGRNDGVSVATYKYPQGTKLFIEGIGERVVQTVTAKRFSDRVDIWFGDSQDAYERCIKFGVKQLSIEVIK
jgi:3D (Asp-Asp-Asp) domain-containing protein